MKFKLAILLALLCASINARAGQVPNPANVDAMPSSGLTANDFVLGNTKQGIKDSGFSTVPCNLGGTGVTSGTSGGILAFTGSCTLASSAALTNHGVVLGGGAGAAPHALSSLGTTSQVLIGNASGDPTWGTLPPSACPGATTIALGCVFAPGNPPAAHHFLTGYNGSVWLDAQPAFTDISGVASAAQIPNPTASTIGGIESFAAVTHQWINTLSTSGVPSATQPAFSDISGSLGSGQFGPLTGDASNTGYAITVSKTGGVPFGTAAKQNTGTSGHTLCFLDTNCVQSGTYAFSASMFANADVYFGGQVTPSAISASTNDYAPTGNLTNFLYRISATSIIRTITGFSGGTGAGRVIAFENTGTIEIDFVSESSSSSAANRFHLPVTTWPLQAGDTLPLIYDGTLGRWVPLHSSVPPPSVVVGHLGGVQAGDCALSSYFMTGILTTGYPDCAQVQWSYVQSTPTTVAGYGIADAAVLSAANTFTVKQTINVNTATAPSSPLTNVSFFVNGANAGNRIGSASYGQTDFTFGARYDGTGASPTALLAGESITDFFGYGYDGSALGSAGGVRIMSVDAFTPTDHKSEVCLAPVLNLTAINNLCAFGDGGVVIATPTSGDMGPGTLNVAALYENGIALSTKYAANTIAATGSIPTSGSLLQGQCTSNAVTVTGATTGEEVSASPTSNPNISGLLFVLYATISSSNTVTLYACSVTPGVFPSTTFNIRVLP